MVQTRTGCTMNDYIMGGATGSLIGMSESGRGHDCPVIEELA